MYLDAKRVDFAWNGDIVGYDLPRSFHTATQADLPIRRALTTLTVRVRVVYRVDASYKFC
jgi:hypothetical protein